MDDVDYLVEDNAMDDFSYHRKWMGPMVVPGITEKVVQDRMAQWQCKLGTKCKCLE